MIISERAVLVVVLQGLLLLRLVVSVVFRAVRRNLSGRECLYADGGMLDQYPIYWFDGTVHLSCAGNCLVHCRRGWILQPAGLLLFGKFNSG